jgi:RNA polymerase-interacting CarD/CdnL/TRCF family regulator
MPFSNGDQVVHCKHGLGRVLMTESRRFGPGSERLYYRVAISNGTIWVPVDGAQCGLRRLTAKGDLERYRRLLASRPTPLSSNYRQRQIELSERMKQSSFQAKCEVVRDLAALGWREPLRESLAALLRDARGAVDEEWAAVEGLTVHEATREIEALLLKGKRAYME